MSEIWPYEPPFLRYPRTFDVDDILREFSTIRDFEFNPSRFATSDYVDLPLVTHCGGYNVQRLPPYGMSPILRRLPAVRRFLAALQIPLAEVCIRKICRGHTLEMHIDPHALAAFSPRAHLALRTDPNVTFHCRGQALNIQPGEVYFFDRLSPHAMENPTCDDRIHLIFEVPVDELHQRYPRWASEGVTLGGGEGEFLVDRRVMPPLMHPDDIDRYLLDLRQRGALHLPTPVQARVEGVLGTFSRAWRGDWSEDFEPLRFGRLREAVNQTIEALEALEAGAGVPRSTTGWTGGEGFDLTRRFRTFIGSSYAPLGQSFVPGDHLRLISEPVWKWERRSGRLWVWDYVNAEFKDWPWGVFGMECLSTLGDFGRSREDIRNTCPSHFPIDAFLEAMLDNEIVLTHPKVTWPSSLLDDGPNRSGDSRHKIPPLGPEELGQGDVIVRLLQLGAWYFSRQHALAQDIREVLVGRLGYDGGHPWT